MKKILTVLFALLVIISLTATTAFAYSEESESDGSVYDVSVTDESAGAVVVTEQAEDGAADDNKVDEGTVWADEAYGIALKNADKIFALLACVSSLIVGFAYKKGLLPLVKNAISTLGSGVASLKEHSERAADAANGALTEAAERLSRAEECFGLISERLAALENELEAARESSVKDKELRLILNSQIDMLYEIFMSSALPSYQKDAVGERVAEMKHALNTKSENE
jgi:hypothetical protein